MSVNSGQRSPENEQKKAGKLPAYRINYPGRNYQLVKVRREIAIDIILILNVALVDILENSVEISNSGCRIRSILY
jgi:hypothetical protein